MTHVFNQTILLKSLLSKFVNILYISDSEIEAMQDYILSSQPAVEFVSDNSEIYETVVYLKDLAQESSYTSIQELVGYFEDQDTRLTEMLEPFISHNPGNNEGPSLLAMTRVFNASMKSNSIRILTGASTIDLAHANPGIAKKLFESITNSSAGCELECGYKELNIAAHCFKSINFLSAPDRILPNSDHYHFKHYFENFSHPKRKYNKIISLVKKLKSWFTFLAVDDPRKLRQIISYQKKQKKKIQSVYEKILHSIQAEQPIKSDSFKTMMSRMMLLSKLNNPTFRDYIRKRIFAEANEKVRSAIEESDFAVKKLYYRSLSDKQWSILKSPDGHDWITSDNPGFSIDLDLLCKSDANIQADPYWIDIDANKMIYFPLSGQYCLRLQPAPDNMNVSDNFSDSVVLFELSSEEELRAVNKLVISSKPKAVISKNKGIQLRRKQSCI